MKPEHWAALRDGVVAALEAGIDAGGSSIDDYRDGRGEKGRMQERFLVHTREGQPCPGDCDGIVERIVVSGRSTYFCPSCQVKLRRRPKRRKRKSRAASDSGVELSLFRPVRPAHFSRWRDLRSRRKRLS